MFLLNKKIKALNGTGVRKLIETAEIFFYTVLSIALSGMVHGKASITDRNTRKVVFGYSEDLKE